METGLFASLRWRVMVPPGRGSPCTRIWPMMEPTGRSSETKKLSEEAPFSRKHLLSAKPKIKREVRDQ